MRRTRFRAWHTEEKKMYSDPLINGLTGEVCIYDQGEITGVYDIETVIPLQYTGLKDRNGTEIYEGDIINICSKGSCNPAKVVFDNEDQKGCFCVIGYLGDLRTYPIKDFVDCEIEVIGNIHENPDLIERSQT